MCQRAELTIRQLAEEKSALEFRLKQLEDDKEQLCTDAQHIQIELKHTLDMLNRYKHTLTFSVSEVFYHILLAKMVSSFGFNVILIGLLQ